MGCETCGQKKCCCEKRISVVGAKGTQGIPGRSEYLYMAYADDVSPGTPDIVVGFSADASKCWVAVITSLIPLVPVQANFQGQWFNRCVSPCNCTITGGGESGTIDQTINSGSYTPVTGCTTGSLPAGVYLVWGEINIALGVDTLVDYTFFITAGATGITRRVGDTTLGTRPNQETQVLSINEKITLGGTDTISLAIKRTGGASPSILHQSISYMKIG